LFLTIPSYFAEDYDERTARAHAMRVRDIISISSNHSDTAPSAPSVLSDLSDDKTPFDGFKLDDLPTQAGQEPNATPNLSQFYPKPAAAAAKCVHRIVFSGFNPPPGNRRLQGDLFYLDVTTLEGETLCITASSRGFFVNNSKLPNTNGSAPKFDPSNKDAKNTKIYRNLVACLTAASTQFSRLIGDVAARVFERQASIETQMPPFQVYPWLAKPRPHEHDVFRSEEALKYTHETDLLTGNTGTDWNEDLQTIRDMPRGTVDERVSRDNQLFRFHTDFVDTISRGAQYVFRRPFNASLFIR
jgi:protein TIF31